MSKIAREVFNTLIYEVVCNNESCENYKKPKQAFILDLDDDDNLYYDCPKCLCKLTVNTKRVR